MKESHDLVSSSSVAMPSLPLHGRCHGQDSIMWSTVHCEWLHSYIAESLRPQPFIVAEKHPTAVLRRLSMVQCLRGRSLTRSLPGSSINLCSLNQSATCHYSIQLCMSQSLWDTSAGADHRRYWAHSANEHREFRLAWCRDSAMVLGRRWSSLIAALHDSASTAASHCRGGRVMLARIGSWRST